MKIRNRLIAALSVIFCTIPILSGCSEIDEIPVEVVITSADSLSVNTETDESNYIFSSLDEKEKEYYNLIRDAALEFKTEVVFPEKLEPELIRKLFMAVYYQEEEIFWLHSIFFKPDKPTDRLSLAYRFGSDEVPAMQLELDAAADAIMSQFDENTTDYEKLKTFHDHIVLNCTFSQSEEYVNSVYGVLVDGNAQCEGYAFAFDYLCSLADIDCYTVNGASADGVTHAWNVVKLEDEWYHADCTWDDPILENASPEYLRYYYFLVSDSDILDKTHFPDYSYFTYTECESDLNYYKREGFLVSDPSDTVEIFKKSAMAALDKNIVNFGVRFADKSSFEKGYSDLFDRKKLAEVIEYVNAESDRKVLTKKYIRYSDEDKYTIHIALFYE